MKEQKQREKEQREALQGLYSAQELVFSDGMKKKNHFNLIRLCLFYSFFLSFILTNFDSTYFQF